MSELVSGDTIGQILTRHFQWPKGDLLATVAEPQQFLFLALCEVRYYIEFSKSSKNLITAG